MHSAHKHTAQTFGIQFSDNGTNLSAGCFEFMNINVVDVSVCVCVSESVPLCMHAFFPFLFAKPKYIAQYKAPRARARLCVFLFRSLVFLPFQMG